MTKASRAKLLSQALVEVEKDAKGEIALPSVRVTIPAVRVQDIREGLNVSQKEFADTYGFALATVRHWEQGVRTPEGPTRILLGLIARDPLGMQKQIQKLRANTSTPI